MSSVTLDPVLRFVDITAVETIEHLRSFLAPVAISLGLTDVDLSAVTGPHRLLTQRAARYVYKQVDQRVPLYAGIRYLSRLNAGWECWAVFSDRIVGVQGTPEPIAPGAPALQAVITLFRLTVAAAE